MDTAPHGKYYSYTRLRQFKSIKQAIYWDPNVSVNAPQGAHQVPYPIV